MPLTIVRGDICDQKTDAVVNAANSDLLAGGGVCGAIFNKAGYQQLQQACDEIGHCDTGKAVYTPGFALSRYIIHAVGPIYRDGRSGERELLASAYQSSLRIADELELESIAFPLISAGIYGYPKAEALQVAVESIGSYLLSSDLQVRLIIYDEPAEYQSARSLRIARLCHPEPRRMSGANYLGASFAQSMIASKDGNVASAKMESEMVYETVQADRDFRTTEDSFSTALFKIIDSKMMLDTDVYRRANIDRKLFSKIRSDKHYQPSKNTALALCIALKLNGQQANELLAKAGYTLSHASLFDVIIEYCLDHEIYNIYEVNELLFVNSQKTLGGY